MSVYLRPPPRRCCFYNIIITVAPGPSLKLSEKALKYKSRAEASGGLYNMSLIIILLTCYL